MKANTAILQILLTIAFSFASAAAQTSFFTYQGRLNDGGTAANGSYDMQFKLFDSSGAGGQIGSTVTVSGVQAVGGIFTAPLDFGSGAFTGADRFLEIAVSPAGQNNFTTLAPRQKLNSAPYSIRAIDSVNSLNLGGIAADQYVLTNDPRLDANNFVQNTTVQQASVNFNIGGSGSANVFDAAVQFNLGGSRILSNQGTDNLFAGVGAGVANTTGRRNAFFGRNAGNASTGSNDSTFFGANAGLKQATSFANSFFGSGAGQENINGNSLAFFGTNAGNKNVTGVNNSFYGNAAGQENISGSFNTFLGFAAGFNNTTGGNNIFIGHLTGNANTATQVNNSIAIGNGVSVSTSDTIVLGKTGQNTQIPGKLLMGGGVMMSVNSVAQTFSNLGFSGIYTNNLVLDENALNNVLASPVHLCIRTTSLGGGFGGEMLTRCTTPFALSADKTDVEPFAGGLEIVKRLKPVSFRWKDGANEIGLNAEDVAEVAPSLVTRNEKGEIEDVKGSGLSVILINAIKQQQKQIEAQARQIDALEKLLCRSNPNAELCRAKPR